MKRINIPLTSELNIKNPYSCKQYISSSKNELLTAEIEPAIFKEKRINFTTAELIYIYNLFGERDIYNYIHNIITLTWGDIYNIFHIHDEIVARNPQMHYAILSKLLGTEVSEETCANDIRELLANPTKYIVLNDDLDLPFAEYDVIYPNLRYITGDINLANLKDATGLYNLMGVGGKLNLDSLEDAKALANLKYIGGDASFSSLTDAEGLNNLEVIYGGAIFPNLISAEGLEKLFLIDGYADFGSLVSSKGLESLHYIGGIAHFNDLKDATGLCNLEKIADAAYFNSLESVNGLEKLKSINGLPFETKTGYQKIKRNYYRQRN